MGVCELENFVNIHLKDGTNDVSVLAEIENFKQNNDGKRPILVFDVMSFVGKLCHFKTDTLCGGRHKMCGELLDDLFKRLSSQAELVFFLDGFVQASKYQTWQHRQKQKYKDMIKIIDMVDSRNSLKSIIDQHGGSIYTNIFLNVIEDSCKKYGQLRYAVDYECDKELARFAYQNPRVLAVFSNDSDFMIFPGEWRYFSIKDLDFKDLLHTKEFNRKALREYLKLNTREMAIFATLAGNDIIRIEELRKFQERFGLVPKTKFRTISYYIRKTIGNMEHHSVLQFLGHEIFGSTQHTYIGRINDSINSYNVTDGIESVNSDQLKQHNLFTYNVIEGSPLQFTLTFFDLRKNDMKRYDELSIPMLQRQAGILFLQESRPDQKVKIQTKTTHAGQYSEFLVVPEIPVIQVPSREQLCSDNSEIDDTRYALLKWSINWEKLQPFHLQEIPSNYMIAILTILFMKYEGVIDDKEADIFLWTIKNSENELVPMNLPAPKRLDPRAFRLAFLYVKLFANVARSIEVCGMKKKYWKPCNFDGVFFHQEYLRFKNIEFDTKSYLNQL